MSRYPSPDPSLPLFKWTWHPAFLQGLLAEGHWLNTELPVESTGPRWAQCWQSQMSLSQCKFTLCCSWLATHSPSPKPACSGLQEWGLPCECSDPPPCRRFLLAQAAPGRSVNTGGLLKYAGIGQLSYMCMMAFPQPFFCYCSFRWCWNMTAGWLGTIILHRKSNMDVTLMKHLKNVWYQVGRLMVPGTFQNMNSVLKDFQHKWLKPLSIGKFGTCLPHYHFHSNLNSSPIRIDLLAFVGVCQSAPFPKLWTINWDAGILWWYREALPCLEKGWTEVSCEEGGAESCVCPCSLVPPQ